MRMEARVNGLCCFIYNGESTIHISVTNKNGAGESIAELDVDLK